MIILDYESNKNIHCEAELLSKLNLNIKVRGFFEDKIQDPTCIDWKAIGKAKAGKRYKPVEKFRKFEKTENTFTLKIRETWQK